LKIERIEIQNFGIISDVDLDLSGPQGGLVFINGLNGRGKTTFQSAIKWCFYGDEPSSTTKFASRYGMKNLKEGDSMTVRAAASLRLDDANGTAHIERTQAFVKQANGIPKKLGNPTLKVWTKSADSATLTDIQVNPETWINQYFPKKLINFFLFDGELMTNFFRANVKEDIENAIRQIAGVDLFDEIATKLEAVESKQNRFASKLSGPKSEQTAIQLETEQKIYVDIVKEFNDAKTSLESKKYELEQVLTILGSSRDVDATAKRIDELDKKIAEYQIQRESSNVQLNSILFEGGMKSLMVSCFEELATQVEKAITEDRFPPSFDPVRIRALIDLGRCICGCDLSPGDDRTNELLNLIEKHAISTDVGKLLDYTLKESEKIMIQVKADWQTSEMANNNVIQLERLISECKEEKNTLSIQLQGSDVASVRAAAIERDRLDDEIEKLIGLKRELELQGKSSEAKIKGLNLQLQSLARENADALQYRDAAVMARKVADAARQIHSIAIAQVRQELQVAISEKFSVVKAGKFRTEITESFDVLTLYEDGSKVDLSEGESMAKAYVFSLALRSVIGLNFPLIVDTPFGRLSGDFRAYLTDILTAFLGSERESENRQVIFLMTDTEYTPYSRKRFAKVEPLEFYLAYEEGNETDKSVLGTGIDPEWLKTDYWKDWAEKKIQ